MIVCRMDLTFLKAETHTCNNAYGQVMNLSGVEGDIERDFGEIFEVKAKLLITLLAQQTTIN